MGGLFSSRAKLSDAEKVVEVRHEIAKVLTNLPRKTEVYIDNDANAIKVLHKKDIIIDIPRTIDEVLKGMNIGREYVIQEKSNGWIVRLSG
jgi:hypothetical protein